MPAGAKPQPTPPQPPGVAMRAALAVDAKPTAVTIIATAMAAMTLNRREPVL
jgi:hypothetical protein